MAAGSKKTTSAKKNTKPGRPRKQPVQPEPESFIRAEVFIILSFAAAVLLFLSNFHLCGVAGDFLRSVQLGIFGVVGYAAPLLLFIGTCFYLSNRGSRTAAVKMAAVIAEVLVLCGLFQLFFGGTLAEGEHVFAYYRMASAAGKGGGLVGGILCGALRAALGTVGAFLVLAVCFVICGVVITEKSVVRVVKKHSDAACQYAREDMERRRELHAERAEERRRLREERRVRGVNLDSTRLEAMPEYEPDDAGETGAFSGSGPVTGNDAAYAPEPVPNLEQTEENTGERPGRAAAMVRDPREARGLVYEDGALRETEPAALEPDMQSRGPESSADVFTGNIAFPPSYEDDDEVPFDVEPDSETGSGRIPDAGPAPGEVAMTEAEKWSEAEREPEFSHEPVYQPELLSDEAEEIDMGSPMTESQKSDTLFVPEAEKRVVTASGKVIETDTEMLKKKLESRKKAAAESENGDAEPLVEIRPEPPKKEYVFPSVTLLKRGKHTAGYSEQEYKETAIKLQQTLRNFGVGVTVTNISCGPSVTRYELHPEQGVKVSKIVGLADDIKLSLAAEDIRIEAPIPGKSAVGIEVPNKETNMVYLRELLESDAFQKHPSTLAFAVGKDIGGQVVVTDIAKMPHLLVAGATGSGKSVCINTLIMSIIFKSKPEDVKLIMVDPKVVELSVYNGIPHLLIPVVTDPKKASGALNWAVAEMTDRYKKFAEYNVRDLKGYNAKIQGLTGIEEDKKPAKLPQIVIIVDELADLMMVAPGEVEDAICRLAQLARAAGIHLVIATQRPSVNVITGLIKANVPSRIAFSVSSGVDSRTIIDMNGAEKLLGKGDMLFYPSGFPKPQRVQGAFVSDQEVQKVVEFLTEQGMTAEYSQEVESQVNTGPAAAASASGGRDEYFDQAAQFIIEKEKASIGMLQRMFKIGFNRAARIMDQLAEAGVVGEEEGTKPRKVLMTMEEFNRLKNGE